MEREALTAFYAAENPSGVLEGYFRREGMDAHLWIEGGEERLGRLIDRINRWELSAQMNFRVLPWEIRDVVPLEDYLFFLDMSHARAEAQRIRSGRGPRW